MTLRARIVALAVGAATAVLVLLAVPVGVSLQRGEERQAEQEAATLAQGVADVASAGATTDADLAAVVDRANDRRGDTPVAARLADGTLLGDDDVACPAAGGEAIALAGFVAGFATGFATGRDDDRERRGDHDDDDDDDDRDRDGLRPVSQATSVPVDGGRVVSVTGGTVVVCAFVADGVVREQVAEQLGVLGLAGVVVLVVVAGIALLVARRLATHLTVAASTADRLGEGDLDARVPDVGPVEVRRVGAALNRLAGRIDELLTIERETVADLSHRLRTPMTTLRLDVEALPPSPAKAELEDHFDQLDRTLTAVIAAARRPQREGAAPTCRVAEIVRERFDYWEPLLEEQDRSPSLAVDLPDDALVRCAAEDLAAALDALLENAVAHTGEGVAVRVVGAWPAGSTWAVVDVLDRGPGVPPIALERGRSDRGSSGLGLDIARGCAESTGGRIELGRDADGWARVRLVLGAP